MGRWRGRGRSSTEEERSTAAAPRADQQLGSGGEAGKQTKAKLAELVVAHKSASPAPCLELCSRKMSGKSRFWVEMSECWVEMSEKLKLQVKAWEKSKLQVEMSDFRIEMSEKLKFRVERARIFG